jgi:hypothetical protein
MAGNGEEAVMKTTENSLGLVIVSSALLSCRAQGTASRHVVLGRQRAPIIEDFMSSLPR